MSLGYTHHHAGLAAPLAEPDELIRAKRALRATLLQVSFDAARIERAAARLLANAARLRAARREAPHG